VGGQGQDRTVDLPLIRRSVPDRGQLPKLASKPCSGTSSLVNGADAPILTPVPRCAGECRFVRVARVLDPSQTRTCVALVSAAEARPAVAPAPRTRRPHIGTRARPRPEDRLPLASPLPPRPGQERPTVTGEARTDGPEVPCRIFSHRWPQLGLCSNAQIIPIWRVPFSVVTPSESYSALRTGC